MGRWTQYDDDDYRLPEGMKRVSYDADTQQYTFRKGNELWLGEPGSEYGGNLTRVGTVDDDGDDDVEAGLDPQDRSNGYQLLPPDERGVRRVQPNRHSYRMLLPYMVIIGAFLLFVLRFITGNAAPILPPQERMCPGGPNVTKHHVKQDDTCWGIANFYGSTVEALLNETLNPGLECDRLRPGDVLCIPNGS